MNTPLIPLLLLLSSPALLSAENAAPTWEYSVQPVYGYRSDGKPGREVKITLPEKLQKKAFLDINIQGKTETTELNPPAEGASEFLILLPENIGVENPAEGKITLRDGENTSEKNLTVDAMKHWKVYLYNHSHVDIGYTNTHKNVEILHKTNIREGIKLGEESKDYIRGAAYRWNPEVTWPLERLWQSNPEEREKIIDAIKKDYLCIDASYVNLNTSTCSDEELFHIFDFSRKMQKITGKPMDVFQQLDIPGMSWGLVPVMAQEGVKYIMSWPNSDRGGNAHKNIDGQPMWWVAPDGKSRVLFFQPGSYANSGSMSKGRTTGRPWFGQRDPNKVPAVIKTGEANVDFTAKCQEAQKANSPFDFLVLSWTLWDNCPLDADIPQAAKTWNERYAYPQIIISGGHEIMSMIEQKYGDTLPVVKGDYTEYWTDGLGTASRLTAMNRVSKEKLTQAETVWTMLNNGMEAPREEFNEAWRYIALGSEHTYCAENPSEPYFQEAIWKVKQSYFHEAADRTASLMDESLAPATDKSNGALGSPNGPANGGIAVFNTHSWDIKKGLVTVSPAESRTGDLVVDSKGKECPSQRLSSGELVFFAENVPALSSRHYRIKKGTAKETTGCKITDSTLENGIVRVSLDPKSGNITELISGNSDYNYAKGDGVNTFSWLPANIDKPEADTVEKVSVTENGPLVVELRVESQAKGCRKVIRSVRLVQGQPWVEISNIVDKLPLLEKDGIHFGFEFNIPESKTRLDIPWGIMEIEKDQWPQGNRNWLAIQRWVDISNDKTGVTLCSLDAPLIEHGARSANISLSWGDQGPWLKKLEPSSTLYSWVMNNHWHTNFPLTQEGEVNFRYRILPHGAYSPVESNRFGVEQSQPLVYVLTDKDPEVKPFLSLDNQKVYVTILKPTDEKGTSIVRLRSLSDQPETVQLSFPAGDPKSIHKCDQEEIPSEKIEKELTILPLGMVTLRIEK